MRPTRPATSRFQPVIVVLRSLDRLRSGVRELNSSLFPAHLDRRIFSPDSKQIFSVCALQPALIRSRSAPREECQ